MGLKERTEQYLNDKGVNPLDIPKALATFTGVKYVIWLSFVTAGMRYRPLKLLFNRPVPQRWRASFQRTYPEFYDRNYNRMISAAEGVANTRVFRSIADTVSSAEARKNRSGAALGLAEGMLLYKFTLPIHLPMTFWAVTKYYMGRPNFNPATPFEGLAEDLASDSIYENRIMNAYEEDIKRILKFTQDKFIPEYIYTVPIERAKDAGEDSASDSDPDPDPDPDPVQE